MAPVIDEEPVDPEDELMFVCLGGGMEVGRSCHILEYKGKTVMVRLAQSISATAADCPSLTLVCTQATMESLLSPSTMSMI